MRRATNQDALAVLPEANGAPIRGDAFLMVADGMGAHAAGELASRMAIQTVPHTYTKCSAESAPAALRQAVREANDLIHSKGNSADEFHGMGTTCSCLVVTQGVALVSHVGDSRIYRLRRGVLEQLTFDHSLVWEMAAASNVSEDKVPSCIPKNVITRSLGPHESVIVDLEGPLPLQHGDVFLLCSDGLSGVVDDTLAGGVLSAVPPEEAAQTLVDLANLRGGPDNISVVVAAIDSAKASAAEPDAPSTQTTAGTAAGVGMAAAAACAVACFWFLSSGHVMGMLIAAAGMGAAIAYSFAARPDAPPTGKPRGLDGSYGNGPYRRTECGDRASAAGDLRDLVRELSNLDSEEDTVRGGDGSNRQREHLPLGGKVPIDWAPFKKRQEEADGAFERGEFAVAIAGYSALIRSVMKAVREDDGTHRYRAGGQVVG